MREGVLNKRHCSRLTSKLLRCLLCEREFDSVEPNRGTARKLTFSINPRSSHARCSLNLWCNHLQRSSRFLLIGTKRSDETTIGAIGNQTAD